MFLRPHYRKRNGRREAYWALVESYRTERGPRQRTVALELDEFLKRALPRGRETVPWSLTALILVIARLCEPSSELHIGTYSARGRHIRDSSRRRI